MLGSPSRNDTQNQHAAGIRCFVCPGGLVRLQWYRALSLHFDYADLVSALDCLDDVMSTPPFGFALGSDSFCACHAGDGCYYLLCRDHVVLRLFEEEARVLRRELATARALLDPDSDTPARVM